MPVLLVGLFSGAMAILGGAIGGAAAQSTPVSDAFDSASVPTALLVTATNDPFAVPANDGMVHLEYDLIVGNVFPAPVILSAVEVVTPHGNALRRWEGGELAARVQPVFYSGPVPEAGREEIEIPAGMAAVIMDVTVPPDRVPSRISHRIDYAFPPGNSFASLVNGRSITGPELALDPREPIVLAPPLRGKGWFAGDACCAADSAHRS